MVDFFEWCKAKGLETNFAIMEKDWIQNAVNPEHKGYCTPMTKDTCTPRRKALAIRFKKGDIHAANEKKND